MYKGCTLRTYSLPSPVFYLKSESPYVNLQFTFFTHLYYIVSVYQCIQTVYLPVFQLSKVETPFPKRILTATNPDFEFGFPVHFRHVYQCISDVYSWFTASKKHAVKFCKLPLPAALQCRISTCKWVLRPPRLEMGRLKDLLTRRNAGVESETDSNRCHI